MEHGPREFDEEHSDLSESDEEDQQESDKESQHEPDKEAVKSCSRLRTEIETLIEPHRHSDDKPPFSAAELVVIAIICSDVSNTTQTAIFDWIICTFRYYSTLAVKQYLRYMSKGLFGKTGHASIVVKGFKDVFEEYEVPLTAKCRAAGDIFHGSTIWSVTPSQARLFLLSHRERSGTFRFFDLPRELRDHIYEALLVYPKGGVTVHRREVTVEYRINESIRDVYKRGWEPIWTVRDFNRNLQLLQTCRQIYKEAMPIHHGSNEYTFDSQDSLARALRRLPPDRARQFKKVSLVLSHPADAKYTKKTEAIALATASQLSLQVFIISLRSASWLEYIKYEKYPGMQMISTLARRAQALTLLPRYMGGHYFLSFERYLMEQGVDGLREVRLPNDSIPPFIRPESTILGDEALTAYISSAPV